MDFDTVEPLVCEYFQMILTNHRIQLSDASLDAAINELCDLICNDQNAALALEAAANQYLK